LSNQHLAKGRHKREIDRRHPKIEIVGFAFKAVPAMDGRLFYVITMPKLKLSCYDHLTETVRLVL
jgi:hypothetical protein